MKDFIKWLRETAKTKEGKYMIATNESSEKRYDYYDIKVRQNIINGDISIYTKEVLESDRRITKERITNIENEEDIVDFRLLELPGGRPKLEGYINKEDGENHVLYGFHDIWYKVYGESLSVDRKFTKEELLEIAQDIREKMKQAKFEQLYVVKYKDSYEGKKEFNGSRYFAAYSTGEGQRVFEQIKDEDSSASTVDNNKLLIKVGKNEIDTNHTVYYTDVRDRGSDFKVELLCTRGRSRVFCMAKYTPDALIRIIEEYERKLERDGEDRDDE